MTHVFSTPKGDINVRIATPEDATPLLKLRIEALSMHPEAFAADVDKTTADGAEAWVERILEYEKNQSGAITIACAGDDLIGMTGIVRGHWPKTLHSANIWGVYVNPDWRGLHIAEKIMDECITWAQEHGVVVVKLGVITGISSAIRCYTRCGFTVYGTEPKVTHHNGVYYDELLMVRSI
jgi:RimJ/RimL family protein N-acetyltransferase